MGRPSVIPAVLERLEDYLDKHEAVYLSAPELERQPTLPATNDGKINIRAVAEAIGLRKTQEKYLFEREELSSLINFFAQGQGLLPIGARTMEIADQVIKERMTQQARSAKADAQAAVEARAAEQRLLGELQSALEEIEQLKSENMRLRAQLELIHAGVLVRVD